MVIAILHSKKSCPNEPWPMVAVVFEFNGVLTGRGGAKILTRGD